MWRVPYFLIRAYQRLLSPLLAPACRFHPSCSEYSAQALRRLGLIAGGWLAVRRLLRCHPWHAGGYDPVPPRVVSGQRAHVHWGVRPHG